MTNRDWPPDVFRRRRARILQALGDDAAMVIPAAPEVVVGRDLELRYVVDPDLFYLTGYPEPEAVAVLRPGSDEEYTLFVRERDPARERWTGPRLDEDAVAERYGPSAVFPVTELEERLPELLKERERIHYRMGSGRPEVDDLVLEMLGAGRSYRQRTGRGPSALVDPGLLLDDIRLIKDAREVQAIRDAVAITIDAFHAGFNAARPDAGEWEVEAAVEGAFRRSGAEGPAFATIAGSGPNATVLHYVANDRLMTGDDLLLLDAGARHRAYNADLTRTVPVSGRFQGVQREVYEIVLEAERAAIDTVRPGVTFDDVHRAALDVLVRGMVDLRLLEGDPAELAEDPASWRAWFPHKTSHWLGLDVHDVGSYAVAGEPRRLEPGMVLTIEPGLYIPADAGDAPKRLRGIGVRIEDDVLVPEEGRDVLSADLPTDPDEVSRLVGQTG